LFIDSSQPGSS